jgi:hypothetical protein
MRLFAVLSFVGAAAAFQRPPRRRPIMQRTTGYEPQLPADAEQRTLDLHAYLQKQWWPQGGAPSMAELRALRLQAVAAIDECHLFGEYRKTIVDTRQSSVNGVTRLTCDVGGTAAAATSFV